MFNLKIRKVKKVYTKNRKINGTFPEKNTVKLIKSLAKNENSNILKQHPVLWSKAKNYSIFDDKGNKWIDFSSTIFVTNGGHSNSKIVQAIKKNASKLLHAYSYVTDQKLKFIKSLINFIPKYLNGVTLLSSGSEATERAIKICKLYGLKKNKEKKYIVCFNGNYHGKTLGSAMISGTKADIKWIGYKDPNIIRLDFPYPWTLKKIKVNGKKQFLNDLNFIKEKINTKKICAFFLESYQGYGAIFYPKDYVKALSKWCNKNKTLLVFDEIQAGFGRTGKVFAYQHYGVKPNLVICGKGISGSLPLSALVGERNLLNLDKNHTSTHGGNILCCAAAEANLKELKRLKLVNRSKELGKILFSEVSKWQKRFHNLIPYIDGKGLVCGVFFSKSNNPDLLDIKFVHDIVEKSLERGVFNLATYRGTLKIAPPLTITKSALLEGLNVIEKVIDELYNKKL